MYHINKIAGFILSPMGIAVFALCVTALLMLLKKNRMARWAFGLSVAWMWVWSAPQMGRIVGVPLEKEFLKDGRVPSVETYPEADAIFLLGGGMNCRTNVSGYAEMTASADRVWQAARLYKAGKAPLVIATGTDVRETTEQLLLDLGVPAEAVVFVPEPRNTEEEAKALAKSGVKRALLVTSAWHAKRALTILRKYAPGIEATPAPSDYEFSVGAGKDWTPLELLPNPQAVVWNGVAFREWVGIFNYRFLR